MKLRLLSALALFLAATSFSNAHPKTKSHGLDPILQSLLEFHPGWITRSVTSHDGSGGNDDGSWNGNAPINLDGVDYQTLFHGEGEGAILRLWMTADLDNEVPNDYLELRIEIDGKTFYRGKPLDFFNGKATWKSPVVMGYQETSGSFLSYLPIPYAKDAKILFRGNPHYFQVTYRQGAGSSTVNTADQVSQFMSDRTWVSDLSNDPVNTVPVGQVIATGPTTLSGIKLECTPSQLLDLRVRVGNLAPVPAAFFFGLGTTGSALPGKEFAEVHSELNDITISDSLITLMTRLPIPLHADESLTIESASGQSESISYATESVSSVFPGTHLDMQFHDQAGPGIPTTMEFYSSSGPTQFISLVEQISGNPPGNMRYLEGDEMVRTDGMTYPLQLGTGTEDYFNGGWYFDQGPFTNPNSGEPRFNVIDPGTDWSAAGFEHSVYRHHVLDPIVGRAGMRFGFEAGDIGDFTPIEYQTLATAYRFDQFSPLGAVLQFGSSPAAPIVTSAFDAENNQPQVQLNVTSGTGVTQLTVPSCPALASSFLLTRTYDAATALQAATVTINGLNAGTFFEAYANPKRQFAQDAIWVELNPSSCAKGFNISIAPIAGSGQGWNSANYQVQFLNY
jgi:hypothetical protein